MRGLHCAAFAHRRSLCWGGNPYLACRISRPLCEQPSSASFEVEHGGSMMFVRSCVWFACSARHGELLAFKALCHRPATFGTWHNAQEHVGVPGKRSRGEQNNIVFRRTLGLPSSNTRPSRWFLVSASCGYGGIIVAVPRIEHATEPRAVGSGPSVIAQCAQLRSWGARHWRLRARDL